MKIELLIWLNSLKNLKIFDFLSMLIFGLKELEFQIIIKILK